MCKARKYVNAGKSLTTESGKHYFKPAQINLGKLHFGSNSQDMANWIMFDDESVVYFVDDCVLSVRDKNENPA